MMSSRYWLVLTKWLWLIALTTVIAAGGSYFTSRAIKPVYRASTTLLINQTQNPVTLDYNSLLLSEQLTPTYAELIKKRPVLQSAIGHLGLNVSPEQLAPLISVQAIPGTQLIELTAENSNPTVARDLANTLAQAFIEQNRNEMLGESASSKKILQQQIAKVESDLKATAAVLAQYRQAGQGQSPEALQSQATLSQLQQTQAQLLTTEDQMQLSEAGALDSLRVVEPAVVPLEPVWPKVMQNMLVAGAIGLLIGVAMALLIEFLDDAVKSSDDVERETGLKPLGAIPRFPRGYGAGKPMMGSATLPLATAERFRMLRIKIDTAQDGQPGGLWLITSANPGEGKSTITANLAISIAEAGRRVVAVDCDLRRPSLHKSFDLSNTTGLTNLLIGEEHALDLALQPTMFPLLSVLSSGPIPSDPVHLLASEQMASLLEALRSKADVVLIDTPAAIDVVDAAVLSQRVDGAILVVATGMTPMEAFITVKEMLVRSPSRLIGVVVNSVPLRPSQRRFFLDRPKPFKEWTWPRRLRDYSEVLAALVADRVIRWAVRMPSRLLADQKVRRMVPRIGSIGREHR